MDAVGVGRVRRAQLLGEGPLVRVGVPGGHASHLAVLVDDVDEAQIGHDRDRDLGQALHHLAVVDDLGEHLGRQQQELVAAPGLEQLLDQMLAFGGLRRRVQQLAEVVADRIHELDHRGIALTRVTAQHLDDPDAHAVVADGKGIGALQPVLDQRVRDEALVAPRGRRPTTARRARGPSGGALRCRWSDRAAFSSAKAGAMLGVRVHTCRQTSSWSAESAHSVVTSQSRRRPRVERMPLGRRLVDRGVGQDLEQLARQLRPALQLLLVAGPDDADDDRAGERVVEDADDQLGADVGAVGPLDVDVERASDEVRGLGAHERPVVVSHRRRQ